MKIIEALITEIEKIGETCYINFREIYNNIEYRGIVTTSNSHVYEFLNNICYLEITEIDYLNNCNVIEIISKE